MSQQIVVMPSVSSNKFHRIYGKELSVALESTLDSLSGKDFDFDPQLYSGNEELLFRRMDCWRAYYPATVIGDLATSQETTINFLPWFSGPEVMYNRLAFRARPIAGKIYRWMMFGRFGEEKPFTFAKDKPFINLDFFNKRNDKFLPLFVKIQTDTKELIYLSISGEWSDDAVFIKIIRVNETEAPPCLAAAKP